MRSIYSFTIRLYSLLISIAALFGNNKAALWKAGRKDWRQSLANINPSNKKLTWVHVASLGEFEQARPLIEKIKETDSEVLILLSFFSPSGYEIKKNYEFADKVIYLPSDTRKNASDFLTLIAPNRIIFIKYEFWFNYLHQIKIRQIQCFLVSGIFRSNQHFFRFYGKWFRNHLKAFTHLFVQNNASSTLLNRFGLENNTVTGDTRLDRVLTISIGNFSDSRFDTFSNNTKVIVFGSSWETENQLAISLQTSVHDYKIIIAPHEIDQQKIKKLQEQFFMRTKLLSETYEGEDLSSTQVLIVNEIGMLSKLYRFASLAVIGGGFGSGIHNTLEAIVYGCPVLFGPNYNKFQEAHDLLELKAAFCVNNKIEFINKVKNLLNDKMEYRQAVAATKEYVNLNSGATDKIIRLINQQ